jgi:nitrate/nitrite transport system ATP-binding protein
MAYLELKNVSKGYKDASGFTNVLENINLSIEEGEFIAIVGFTGSGKSTLINLISGLATPDSGEVLLDGQVITGPGPDRGLIFQNYSLMPWLSVLQNVLLSVNSVFPNLSKAERTEHAKRFIKMVSLDHAEHKLPKELSGGMRQRVSVARALAMDPKILLLDEPLSALDALTRGNLQIEIEKIWRENRKTALLITNDVDEGILMADRIIPLTPGPGATLGPEFKVNFDRPRKKMELNNSEEFKKLRNDINGYLMEIGSSRASSNNQVEYTLPDIKPKNLNERRRVAFAHEIFGGLRKSQSKTI